MLPPPTDRLRFREMIPDDLDDLTAVLAAPDPSRPGRRTRTRDDAAAWIEWQRRNYAEHEFGLWAVETHDGHFVGDCGLTVQDVPGGPYIEVGYHVALDLRGRGFATEAAAAVRRTATHAGIDHLVAIIRPDNLPSQRVAQKIGLRLEDEIWAHGGAALVFGADLLRVVPAGPDQLDAWRGVHNEIIPTAPLTREEVAERAMRNHLTVAFVGDTLVGCATVRPPAGESRVVTVIVRILEPFRGRGLGTSYLEAALADARSLDPGRVETVVLESNADGLEFARRHGFVEHDRYVPEGQTVPFVDLHLETGGPRNRDRHGTMTTWAARRTSSG